MRLRSLKQLIDIVKAMTRPKQITVLGSSSLLASNPDLGEKGRPLELSLDADLLIEPCDEGQAGILHEAIGEGSLFHREYGVYADFMRPEIAETFPAGWQQRCIHLGRDRSVRCLNPIDLALVKLKLGREKDVALLQSMLKSGVINLAGLQKAHQETVMNERDMFKAGRLLRRLELDCEGGYKTSYDAPPIAREAKAKFNGGRRSVTATSVKVHIKRARK